MKQMTRTDLPTHHRYLDPVLTAAGMRAADRHAIDDEGIPGFALMEVAGRAVAAEVERIAGPAADVRLPVVVTCGKGNNGGDGFVAARCLALRGYRVVVATIGIPDESSPDASKNLKLLRDVASFLEGDQVSIVPLENITRLQSLPEGSVYVDALLGTGLQSDLRSPILNVVEWLNGRRAPVVSVDIPTGVHGDAGRVLGDAVNAVATVTMGALKAGLILGEGRTRAGKVSVAEIGIPASILLDQASAFASSDAYVRAVLPPRSTDAHKYSVGLALVVSGAPGLTGAPVMASSAAARIGAGAVVCATHESVQSVVASHVTEVMTLALPGAGDGGIDPVHALEALRPRLEKARALLIGCGLGAAESTATFVRQLCTETELPLVIDADGLRAFEGHTHLIAGHAQGRWILTPHAGEFQRLAKARPGEDRLAEARRWSREWNCILVLKGLPAIVATPEGRVYVCRTGNPALATAGTGDVLAGLITGLLAQGVSPEQAAVAAVHIGGACSDEWTHANSPRTMQATDLLHVLPVTLKARFERIP